MLNILKSFFTISIVDNYFSSKDEIPHALKSNVVCEYKGSKGKSIHYIEFTFDHSKNILGKTVNNFKLLKACKNKFETSISEAILIKRHNPTLNK